MYYDYKSCWSLLPSVCARAGEVKDPKPSQGNEKNIADLLSLKNTLSASI